MVSSLKPLSLIFVGKLILLNEVTVELLFKLLSKLSLTLRIFRINSVAFRCIFVLIFSKLDKVLFESIHSFGKIAPFVHLQKFFSKTASRAVINVKFEQKSASRAEVKHKNGLKTILFRKILGRTNFKHVFRNYVSSRVG